MRASGYKVDEIVVHLEHGALYTDDYSKRAAANARLVSAAPDLLDALRWFIDDIDGTHTRMVDFDANVDAARAAIAKATAARHARPLHLLRPCTQRSGRPDGIDWRAAPDGLRAEAQFTGSFDPKPFVVVKARINGASHAA